MYLYDDKGNRFMDLESGVWCVSLGHNNPRIGKIITERAQSLMHAGFCYSNPILDQASAALLDKTDSTGGKCVFLCSGSEAIEISRQISQHLTGRALSMTLHDSYLGSYASVTNRSKGWYIFNWEKCRACPKKETCDPSCTALRTLPPEISDFTFEPGSASGVIDFPPTSLVQNLVRIVRKNGGKVIANEVTTGVGRTGRWFGYQHYDIEPDLIAVGKGIGNGYPVSAAVISKTTVEELAEKPFRYSQSHQNDPLGAAVVHGVIEEIEDKDLIRQSMDNGSRFLAQLESLVDGRVVIGVRGRGMMLAVDLADEKVADAIHDELIHRGFIVGHRGALFRIDPPLVMNEDEISAFIAAFKDAAAQYKVY